MTTECKGCGHVQEFHDGEIGRAWLLVEVHDGGDMTGPILVAEFCSPACVASWFTGPDAREHLGTICFPKPCNCGSNGKDHIPGCEALEVVRPPRARSRRRS